MEHIKTWKEDDFALDLWDTYNTGYDGKHILHYEFRDRGKIIFKGEDFRCSPLHAIDSDATVASLLGFLSLGEHDTDSEYFESYTPEQIEWRDERAELLGVYAFDLERG